ncbi:MAG: hypothetical protein DMD48_14065 [Gemmatimonadetes bacterium]|nr:MAG: hypothetical protein DMD48_14065 [Gemmatimonadota bacterium]
MTTTQSPVRAPSRPLSGTAIAAQVQRPPYIMAACVAAGALLLYLLTLAPTTQFWDTSEYIAAAYSLGIPHPPGNPLFVLMAHVWGLIPLVSGYAERINLFAALTSAVSAGCWFLVGERWLRSFVPALWPRRLAALAGAIVSATAFTVWNQSVVNEKVYTLSLLSIALILWLIVRWDDQPAGDAHDHYLLLIIYLLALTATNHMMGVLVGPVVGNSSPSRASCVPAHWSSRCWRATCGSRSPPSWWSWSDSPSIPISPFAPASTRRSTRGSRRTGRRCGRSSAASSTASPPSSTIPPRHRASRIPVTP